MEISRIRLLLRQLDEGALRFLQSMRNQSVSATVLRLDGSRVQLKIGRWIFPAVGEGLQLQERQRLQLFVEARGAGRFRLRLQSPPPGPMDSGGAAALPLTLEKAWRALHAGLQRRPRGGGSAEPSAAGVRSAFVFQGAENLELRASPESLQWIEAQLDWLAAAWIIPLVSGEEQPQPDEVSCAVLDGEGESAVCVHLRLSEEERLMVALVASRERPEALHILASGRGPVIGLLESSWDAWLIELRQQGFEVATARILPPPPPLDLTV
ncbi:MAG: hypothetical protein K1X75_05065 [Leptospirales bacterium]|nr:hypothetical protein [Leptospirales bacterium]